MEIKAVTVTQLNNHVKSLLDSDVILDNIAVRGELSNYKIYPSGHHYFTLKDAECSVRCVMFKGNASKLRFKPESGMGVTAVGRVSVYPRDGAYQLYCNNLLPEGTGDLQLAYEQLKKKLQKEGLFDTTHKKAIPRFPKKIAVITSGAGAAVRDIIRVSGKRWPMAKIIVLPVRVQGTEAPAEITGAIRYANKYMVGDLIITGRGGGSIEDLWAFNDERVARAIYDSEIPVISAVGHEPDVTISDYVADLRAATPSNGAELAVPDCEEYRELLEACKLRAYRTLNKEISTLRSRLGDLSTRRIMQNPAVYVEQKRLTLDSTEIALTAEFERNFNNKKQQFVRLTASLDALSPLKVLSRGYSISTDCHGKTITSSSDVSKGECIKVNFAKSALVCTVDEKIDDR